MPCHIAAGIALYAVGSSATDAGLHHEAGVRDDAH